MNDIGARGAHPLLKPFASADRRSSLCFIACQRRADRKAKDRDAGVIVAARRRRPGFRRDDLDVVIHATQPLGERSDIHFGSAEAIRKIPADGLDNAHA